MVTAIDSLSMHVASVILLSTGIGQLSTSWTTCTSSVEFADAVDTADGEVHGGALASTEVLGSACEYGWGSSGNMFFIVLWSVSAVTGKELYELVGA